MLRVHSLRLLRRALAGLLFAMLLVLGSVASPARAEGLDATAPVSEAVGQWLQSLPRDYYNINNVESLKNVIASNEALLIDVREPREYRRGHIGGAKNIPLRDLARRSDRIPRDRPVVLYCTTGYRTAMGVSALRLLGYENVSGFAPSFQGWKAAGEPVETSSWL